MTMSLDEVSAISRAVAKEYQGGLEVLGVASAEGGAGRVELLVTISGCHRDPCVLMLNLTRGDRTMLQRELRNKLREALTAHTVS
jgi:hypothetical protein